mmetsp:Transcript_599/g.811  ORF Transcript_599/g.811 Transcript_599/m.811 type:complete len:123 (-) Transcript_599:22-390(-)
MFCYRIFLSLLCLARIGGFVLTPSKIAKVKSQGAKLCMKWDGKSEPKKNPLLENLNADASWSRENDRLEVWEDKPNPIFDWMKAYLPTDEEVEAAAAGYDFLNPEEWLAQQNSEKTAVKDSK